MAWAEEEMSLTSQRFLTKEEADDSDWAKELKGLEVDDFLSQDDDDSEELTHRPFFQLSSGGSSLTDKRLVEVTTDLMLDFSDLERAETMTEEERELLFTNLVEVLNDNDVQILAGVLAQQGYGEHLLQTLDSYEPEEEYESDADVDSLIKE